MERLSPQPREMANESDAYEPHGQQPRRKSFTPSMRRERPALRSSPLAGPSYSADGAGNVVEHTSALEEEIARRRTALTGLTDEDLSRLANLPTLSPTPALSYSSSPNPSRKGSLETIDDPPTPRRARPSFISLGPQGSRPGSRDSLAPPTPTSPTLRTRHSSPHLSVNVKPNPEPVSADWMTAAPAASFSRMGVRGSGVVMPVKASSRAGERIRQRSTTNQPAAVTARPSSSPQTSTKPRSLKSFRSMSRILRANDTTEHAKEFHPMPTSLSIPGPRSHSSSPELGAREAHGHPSPVSPIAPSDTVNARAHGQSAPRIADSDAEPSRLSGDAEVMGATGGPVKLEGNDRENRVKRLWTKVRKWRA